MPVPARRVSGKAYRQFVILAFWLASTIPAIGLIQVKAQFVPRLIAGLQTWHGRRYQKNTAMDAGIILDGTREVSMRKEKMEAIVFRICVAAPGWTVIESTCRKSIADFEARDDALEYAISLAQSQPQAVVEVYGEGGLLEARSEYAFGAGDADGV